MVDPVAAVGTRHSGEVTVDFGPQGQDFGAGPVDPADQRQFEAMLDADGLRVAQADNVHPVVDAGRPDNAWVVQPGPAEAAPPPTMVEAATSELQDLRDKWNELRTQMDEVNKGDIPLEEAFRLSMEFQHSSVMIQLLLNQVTSFNQEIGKLMRAS